MKGDTGNILGQAGDANQTAACIDKRLFGRNGDDGDCEGRSQAQPTERDVSSTSMSPEEFEEELKAAKLVETPPEEDEDEGEEDDDKSEQKAAEAKREAAESKRDAADKRNKAERSRSVRRPRPPRRASSRRTSSTGCCPVCARARVAPTTSGLPATC